MIFRGLKSTSTFLTSSKGLQLKPAALSARSFRAGRELRITQNKKQSGISGVVEADNATFTTKLHHITNYGLAALVPAALVLSPSSLNAPVDLALAFILPIHSHIGVNATISDYVPKPYKTPCRVAWTGVTGIMLVGLLALNFQSIGITESVKTLWREPKSKKE